MRTLSLFKVGHNKSGSGKGMGGDEEGEGGVNGR